MNFNASVRPQLMRAVGLLGGVAVLLTACTADGYGELGESGPTGDSIAFSDDSTETPLSGRGTTSTPDETGAAENDPTESIRPTSSELNPPETVPPGSVPEDPSIALRPAPIGPLPLELLLWDNSGVRKMGHSGDVTTLADGPFVEVADVPFTGIVFQRAEDTNIIWFAAPVGPQHLLVGEADHRLQLEGSGLNAAGEPLVYYQRHVYGDELETRSTLRSYNFSTKEVREITTTGGWESGTSFSHIATDIVVGRWGAEGYEGITQLSVETGSEFYDSSDVLMCFDGESGCPSYRQVTMLDGQIYGVGPVRGGPLDEVEAIGIFRFEPSTNSDELVASFPRENGVWYAEDMFALGNELVLSLRDIDDNPLPALLVNPQSGEIWSLPEAAFVRPAYLS